MFSTITTAPSTTMPKSSAPSESTEQDLSIPCQNLLSSSRSLRFAKGLTKSHRPSAGAVEHQVVQAVRRSRLTEQTLHKAMWVANDRQQIDA
jgi:hypothetical protein